MTNQLDVILNRVAEIQRTISFTEGSTSGSITDAFPYPVNDPSIANCPFFYNEYNGGPVALPVASGMYQVTNNIDMVLCVVNWEAEMDMRRVLSRVGYWRQPVLTAFAQQVRLGNDIDFILDAKITNISDFQKVSTEGSTEWGALTFTLRVTELFPVVITP